MEKAELEDEGNDEEGTATATAAQGNDDEDGAGAVENKAPLSETSAREVAAGAREASALAASTCGFVCDLRCGDRRLVR